MKNKGKIALYTLFIILFSMLTVTWLWPSKAEASFTAKTYVLPYNGETAKTIVLRDIATGNVISATDGTSTASTTWAAGEIEGSQHSISNDWTFSIPSMPSRYAFFTVYDAAASSVDKTTTPSFGPYLYDAQLGMAVLETTIK